VGADESALCVSYIRGCTVAERSATVRECDDVTGCLEGFKREVPPDSIDAGETVNCSCGSSIISSAAPERKVDCVLDASVQVC